MMVMPHKIPITSQQLLLKCIKLNRSMEILSHLQQLSKMRVIAQHSLAHTPTNPHLPLQSTSNFTTMSINIQLSPAMGHILYRLMALQNEK